MLPCLVPRREHLRQTLVASLVSSFAALALAALALSIYPEWFFRLTTAAGEPVRRIHPPGPAQLTLLVVLAGSVGAGTFLWLRKTTRLPVAASIVTILALQASLVVAYELWEYHESPEFCVRSCHVMEPTYLSYAEPGHNAMMISHLENETASCLDCHTGPGMKGQADLMVTSFRHVWKYVFTKEYNPDDLGGNDTVRTVPDANCIKCHGDRTDAPMPEKHDRFKSQCALCHSPHDPDGTGYFFPERILEKDDCSLCHRDKPLDFLETPDGHGRIAEDDCRDCHVTHGRRDPSFVRGCTDSGCHDMDATNPDSLPSLNHVVFENNDDCVSCHGGAHNLTPPTLERLSRDCTTCHGDRAIHQDDLHSNITGLNMTDCLACHGGALHDHLSVKGSHGKPSCQECHRKLNPLNAPPMLFESDPQSQVSWMRQTEARFAEWNTTGRGTHQPDSNCGDCHRPHEALHVLYPGTNITNGTMRINATCNSACHSWLQEPIEQPGFSNSGGIQWYRGSIDPETLLNTSKDLDGDGRDHKLIFETWGCNGFCHNEAMTLEIAEAWGIPMTWPEAWIPGSGNTEPDIDPDMVHGTINECTDCHRFDSPFGGAHDLHTSHMTLVGAERPIGDSQGPATRESCDYCHASGPYPQNQSGGCYNCHLSGHLPETYYWNPE